MRRSDVSVILNDAVLLPDGKIVAVGWTANSLNSSGSPAALDVALTRYAELTNDPNRGAKFDFDDDGKADTAIFRPTNSNFYIRQSASGALQQAQWGISTDTPVASAYVR